METTSRVKQVTVGEEATRLGGREARGAMESCGEPGPVCVSRFCEERKGGGPRPEVRGEDGSGGEQGHIQAQPEDFQILLQGP